MRMHEQFLADLLQTPDDRMLRGVYADWCEDTDFPDSAACLRWMVSANKRPLRGSTGAGTWFDGGAIAEGLGDEESDLPHELFRRLEGGGQFGNHRTFASLPDAERGVQAAWANARKAGWTPDA